MSSFLRLLSACCAKVEQMLETNPRRHSSRMKYSKQCVSIATEGVGNSLTMMQKDALQQVQVLRAFWSSAKPRNKKLPDDGI